ncbi:MAG: hypothetical protein GW848_15090 [Rhodoferax sp.]|nr:hypothetical protein [Rhodoferax sp.]NCP56039.1 hypothetical protein [Rhodoferax sp.]PIW09930.1 MAG: hypothetical protein COW39_02215 [Comamonadaceae bacterium CG17_big_fil_post_rev_8_21_14_2_50_60_13]PJC11745.1 MAG: hypothetical protein CO066_14015 [Comamonadaceae bacterium CG_4_9_14_0_8_um_filter_60_18]
MKTLLNSVAAAVAALTVVVCAPAQASAQLAADYGCVNCHGAYPRGESPSFEQLAGKMAKYKGDAAALAQKVAKYRTGEPLEHIDAHERLSLEAATRLLRWLADGAR